MVDVDTRPLATDPRLDRAKTPAAGLGQVRLRVWLPAAVKGVRGGNPQMPLDGKRMVIAVAAFYPRPIAPMRCAHMGHVLAYLDPGSGSLIIQVVIATIVAVPFFLRRQISTMVGAIRRSGHGTKLPPGRPGDPVDNHSEPDA